MPVPLNQPHHVPEAIPAIVAGITGVHGQSALNQDVEWLELNNEEGQGMSNLTRCDTLCREHVIAFNDK